MKIELTESQVKKSHPEQYKELTTQMVGKGCDREKFNWSYDYAVRLGGPQPTTLQQALDEADQKYGVSLMVREGQKRSSVGLDVLPEVFTDMVRDSWDREIQKIKKENKFVRNMDRILKMAGKKGSAKNNSPNPPSVMRGLDFMNHVANLATTQPQQFPTLEDIKTHRESVYNDRLSMADGTQIVMYSPKHQNSDEWGFVTIPIKLATRRLKDTKQEGNRFIEDGGMYHTIYDNRCFFNGHLRMVDKAEAAQEGTEFTGWKRTKQYRLTAEEIKSEIGGKIFVNGGVNMGGLQRSMGSGFASFGIGM